MIAESIRRQERYPLNAVKEGKGKGKGKLRPLDDTIDLN